MTNHDKQLILDTLLGLEYVVVGLAIKDDWFGDVLGWNLFASSMIRKSYTIERLKEDIEENKLPLEIKDEPEMCNAFQVFLKNVA